MICFFRIETVVWGRVKYMFMSILTRPLYFATFFSLWLPFYALFFHLFSFDGTVETVHNAVSQ